MKLKAENDALHSLLSKKKQEFAEEVGGWYRINW